MKSISTFLQKHWTWLSGLLLAIWTYVSPALMVWLAGEAAKHPVYGTLILTLAGFLAHISPSPVSKTK
jgi:hypothetical protein